MQTAYFVENGLLILKGEPESEQYIHVYNYEYDFCNENQYYVKDKDETVKQAASYVESGVNRTYAIVSQTTLPDDFDFEDQTLGNKNYNKEGIVYSVIKIDGKIIKDFFEKLISQEVRFHILRKN